MSEEVKPKPSHWLFKQSSELEILISAAIVFAAVTISGVIPQFLVKLVNLNIPNNSPILTLFAFISLFLSTLLPISIISHFILRFYWLSLIGLQTAFEKEQFDHLNYAEPYVRKMGGGGNLNRHIQTIDKVASSLFAFSFLTIFLFCFGLLIPVMLIFYLNDYLLNEVLYGTGLQWLGASASLLFLFMCLLTLFDFVSLGALKKIKKRWFVRLYYPVNRFMNLITLSFFYRGIYYAFVANVPKRILIPVLPLYLALAIFLLNYGYYESRLYTEDATASQLGSHGLLSGFYEDQMDENSILEYPFIETVVEDDNFLKLSIPLTENLDDRLVECDSTVAIQNRGMHWRQWIKMPLNRRELPRDFSYSSNAGHAMECMRKMVTIKVDGQTYDSLNFKFRKHQLPEKLVISTFIDISDFEDGEHLLWISGLREDGAFTIPFIKN